MCYYNKIEESFTNPCECLHRPTILPPPVADMQEVDQPYPAIEKFPARPQQTTGCPALQGRLGMGKVQVQSVPIAFVVQKVVTLEL